MRWLVATVCGLGMSLWGVAFAQDAEVCIGARGERQQPINGSCVCPSGTPRNEPPGSGRYVCPPVATPRPTVPTRPTATAPAQGPSEAQRIAAERAALEAQRRQFEAQRREAEEAARAAAERARQADERARAAEAAQREAEEGRRHLQEEREAQERMAAERAREEEARREAARGVTTPPLPSGVVGARIASIVGTVLSGVSLGVTLWGSDIFGWPSPPDCRMTTGVATDCASRNAYFQTYSAPWREQLGPLTIVGSFTSFAAAFGPPLVGLALMPEGLNAARGAFVVGMAGGFVSFGSLLVLVPAQDAIDGGDVSSAQRWQAAAIGVAALGFAANVVSTILVFRLSERAPPTRSGNTLRLLPSVAQGDVGLTLAGTF